MSPAQNNRRNTMARRRRAIVAVQLVVAIGLLFGLAALTVGAMMAYHRSEESSFWRRAAFLAADAQWKRLLSGAPVESMPPEGAIPDAILLKTNCEPGRGDWEGLRRCTVTASVAMPSGRTAREQVSGYLSAGGQP